MGSIFLMPKTLHLLALSYRSVRNFVIDVSQMPASASGTGLHWQVSQATSLYNIVVEMSTASGNNHQGIFMENGSGGFMGGKVLHSFCGFQAHSRLLTRFDF